MRKGQMIVLKELFAFAFGLTVMISVSGLFAGAISPEISRMSVDAQLDTVLSHINSLITETESLLINGVNTSLTVTAELPNMLGATQFRAYVEANELCVKTFGQFVLKRCAELRANSTITGNHLSGSDLQINGLKNSSGTFISFSNKL